MNTVIIVCVIVVSASIVTGTVFFILTMVQIRRTAKALEGLAVIFNLAAPLFNLVFLGKGLFTKFTKKISGFFNKNAKGGK